jgi:hypothetical protein
MLLNSAVSFGQVTDYAAPPLHWPFDNEVPAMLPLNAGIIAMDALCGLPFSVGDGESYGDERVKMDDNFEVGWLIHLIAHL